MRGDQPPRRRPGGRPRRAGRASARPPRSVFSGCPPGGTRGSALPFGAELTDDRLHYPGPRPGVYPRRGLIEEEELRVPGEGSAPWPWPKGLFRLGSFESSSETEGEINCPVVNLTSEVGFPQYGYGGLRNIARKVEEAVAHHGRPRSRLFSSSLSSSGSTSLRSMALSRKRRYWVTRGHPMLAPQASWSSGTKTFRPGA